MNAKTNRRGIAIVIAAAAVVSLCCGCRFLNSRILGGVFGNYKAEYREKSGGDIPNVRHLQFREIAGNVKITFSDDPITHVKAIKVIRASTRDEAKKHVKDLEVHLDANGDTLTVYTEYPRNMNALGFNGYVDYEIQLPMETSVEGNTVSGDVTVASGAYDVRVTTVSGDATVEDVTSDVRVKTVSGEAVVKNCLGALDLESVSGNITYNVKRPPADNLRLKTASGEVTAYVPEDADLDIDVSTVSGAAAIDLPLSDLEKEGASVSGKLNRATYKMKIATVSGNIRLK